MMSAEVNRT